MRVRGKQFLAFVLGLAFMGNVFAYTQDEEVTGLTNLGTVPAAGDETIIYDADAATLKSVTYSNFMLGNAATASALAADGANASAGNAILGVDADGAAQGAFDVWTEAENSAAAYIANTVEDTTPQLGGDLDLNGNAIDFPTTPNVADVLDEDDLVSDSAVSLATQQSIKAYVDGEIAGLPAAPTNYLTDDADDTGAADYIFGDTDIGTSVTVRADGADLGTNVGILITTNDNDLAAYDPFEIRDADELLFFIDHTGTVTTGVWNAGALTSSAGVTATGTVEGATITEGGVGVPNVNDNLSVFAATSSAQLAGVLSDETGSGGGFVRATSPTIDGPTVTTSISLPSNSIDDILEISASVKSGADLTVITGTAGATGNIGEFDASGDLVSSGVIFGTLTNGQFCKYTSTGTLLDCNVTCADITGSADLCDGADATGGAIDNLFSVAADGKTSTTSSASGLEIVDTDDITLVQGCSDGQLLKFNETSDTWGCANDAGASSGSAIVLDLGDDGGDDSLDLTEIAVTGDTNSIFTESAADKLLIDVASNWPTADTATTAAALSSNPSAATAGYAITDIAADGSVEGQVDVWTEAENDAAAYISATLTDEEVQDKAGAMWSTNTETRATVTYQDADGTIDIVVDDMNDDVPEAGDFGNATDLDANGALNTDSVGDNEIDYTAVTLADFTDDVGYEGTLTNEAGLYAALSDVTEFLETDDSATLTSLAVDTEVYGAGWNADLTVPTKDAVYDKIETLGGGHDAVTLAGTPNYLTLSTQEITLTKLDLPDDINTFTEAQLETAVSDDNPVFDGDIGVNVQAYDADLDDLADGSLTGTKVSASSVTVVGTIEVATAAETTTGTDATRAVSPDALAGSEFGERAIQLVAFDWTTDTATGDGAFYFHVDSRLAGMNIVDVHAEVITAGTTGTTDVQIHNVTSAADVLSTKLTIDSAETGSDTAATAAVINAAEDDLAENDVLRIDVDAVSTTAAKGLIVTIGCRLP